MKKLLFILFFCCMLTQVYAQQNPPSGGTVIKGKVTDERGEALSGVTVTLKETQLRTATDVNGYFSLNPGKSSSKILVLTFIGYQAQEFDITGKLTIDIKMIPASKDLQDVVVTALNIPRQKRSLGYSVQGVNVNDMTEARATNITDLLDGKVSGLQITTSGQPTGSTRVVLRGPSSITGNNQPLWVVDGVPIDNTDSNGQVGNLDYGNNAADLNPDDIESIEVLKGPNAAALYGSKAANGAILVTTKKGKKNAGLGISYNGNYMMSRVLQYPNLQYEYGEGTNGEMSGTLVGPLGSGVIQAGSGGGRNWGGPMLGQPYLSYNGTPGTYVPQEGITDIFQTAYTSTHNLSLSTADDHSSMRISYTRVDGDDIIQKQNVVAKNNLQLTVSRDFTPFLRIDTRVQYIQEQVNDRTARNEDPTNPMNYLNNAVLSIPLSSLIPWKNGLGNEIVSGASTGIENPFWDINEDANQDIHNTIIGGVTATIKLSKDLQFRAQESGNLLWGNRWTFVQLGSLTNEPGSYTEYQQNNKVWNSEGLFMYNKHISDFSIVANAGGNLRSTNYYNTQAGTASLETHDVKNLSNTTSVYTGTESLVRSEVNSVYGTASVGYKDFLYLDITGRNDWSSTLPTANDSFFYPSISASFVFTEILNIPKEILSFGKLRASIAKVGNDTSPYNLYSEFGTNGSSFNGVNYVTFDQTLKDSNLKPELTTSDEIGTELHFLNGRLNLDADVYQSKSINQILTGYTPPEYGFNQEIINGGSVQNKGLEFTINATPIKTENFTWDVVYNFSLNRNKVLALSPGINSILLGQAVTGSVYAEVGQPIGVIRAQDQAYSSSGQAIINATSGLPYYSTTNPILGNAEPKALMSFGSTFRYKRFSFNFLVSSHIGGSIYSGTSFRYLTSGASAQTLPGRAAWLFSNGVLGESGNELAGTTTLYNLPYPTGGRAMGNIFPGYYPVLGSNGLPLLDANGNMIANLSEPNTRYIQNQTYWQQVGGHIGHMYTYDASFVKLTQVIIGYSFNPRFLRKTVFKSMGLSLVGRDLWTIFQKTPPGIDPESAASSGNGQGLEMGGSLPYASYGVDLKLSL